MSSYEDIFRRHHNTRPLSYLDHHLDSPITRVPTPFILRSPPGQYTDRRRPTSICTLSDITTKDFRDRQRIVQKYSTPRYSPRLVVLDPTLSDNIRVSSPKENYPSYLRDSPKLTSADTSSRVPKSPRLPLRDVKLRNYGDNYRHAVTFPDRHLSRRELPLCTPDELLDIIRSPAGYYALPTDPFNEVYPDLYLSDAPTALCTSVLKRIGITHVLNAAQGKEKGCGQVNTTTGFYLDSGIEFLGVPAFDNIVFRLYPYFEAAARFIEDGLKSKGKVLVHCRAGISRSATLVCAFLMLKKGMTAQEAVKTVRKNRAIIPNEGFLQQLCDLNDRLRKKINVL